VDRSRRVVGIVLLAACVTLVAGCGATRISGSLGPEGWSETPEGLTGKIAFSRANDGVWAIDLASGREWKITPSGVKAYDPTWSPDGKKIAYCEYGVGKQYDIYAISGDGSRTSHRRLTSSWWDEYDPAWSPDGRRIAYGGYGDLHVMNADGTGKRDLTTDGMDPWDGDPTWSPDSKRVAWARGPWGSYDRDIWVMNADGTGRRPLTPEHSTYRNLAWSPDGQWIAYDSVEYRGNVFVGDIYLLRLSDRSRKQLTRNPKADGAPAWCPDGKKIAFYSVRGKRTEPDLYIMSSTGAILKRLTNTAASEYEPAWWTPR
jgi:TolB protein